MSRSPREMSASGATRELRRHLGESQRAFAARLGLSIKAVAKYEKSRKPGAKALFALIEAARRAGRLDLWNAFSRALNNEIDVPRNWIFARYEKEPDGSDVAHLHMHVAEPGRVQFALAFSTAMRLTYSRNAKVNAAAAKLLAEFTEKFQDQQTAGAFRE